jgi:hypothetical protein
MRSAARALTVLAVLAAPACMAEPEPSSIPTPTGPCAASREQPPEGSQELREQGDLDGDGRADEVVSWIRDGERVVQAWLATGQNADPEALFSRELLGMVDVDRDGREEVFAQTGDATGGAFVLDGCKLARVTIADTDRDWEYAVGPAAALLCRPNGLIEEAVTEGAETVRRAWRLTGSEVTTADPVGSGPVRTPGVVCT